MTSCRDILTGLYEKVVQGIKVLDSEGVQINPATEESLTDLIDLMNFSDVGPTVQTADKVTTSIPKGTLVTLDTDPTPLPTTPLAERKWVQFVNEDLVDVYLCDSAGVIFKRLEPGQPSDKYVAGSAVLFYGKVAAGTADVGVRVIEGK